MTSRPGTVSYGSTANRVSDGVPHELRPPRSPIPFDRITFRHVCNTQSPKLRLNGVCAYYAMFPLSFPYRRLRTVKRGSWVLDPFCGRGTTNVAARILGLPSVGIDSSPVATAIAAAKLCNVRPSQVIDECRSLLIEEKSAAYVPTGEFWELCFHPQTLEEICKVRESLLEDSRSETRKVLRALMLGFLHGPVRKGLPSYLSNQMPRTYATKPRSAVRFWKRHDLSPARVSLLELVERRAGFYLSYRLPKARGTILRRDSRRELPRAYDGRFDCVVTSPPYLGMNHYLRDQWLRSWFVGGPDKPARGQIAQIKSEDEHMFVSDLANTWSAVAKACAPGARMTIRFGSIPSRNKDPRKVICASLRRAGGQWRILTITDAGPSSRGKRQSDQFSPTPGDPINEIDVHAKLEEN